MSKKKAKFNGTFIPQTDCASCDGEGRRKNEWISGGFFGGGYWEHIKCSDCNGGGKNIWTCLTCKEMMYHKGSGFACVNMNCKMYNMMVLMAKKHE